MRYLPVRERAIRAVQAALEGITVDNGFNFDVRHVYRRRSIPERADDPIEIHLLFGKTLVDTEYNAFQNKEYAQTFIWFIMKETGNDDEDLQYNLFIADLVTRLDMTHDNSDDIYDTTHPRGRIVDVYLKEHLPRYADTRQGLVIGRYEVDIAYVYIKKQPNRWDNEDLDPGVALEE